MLEPTKIILTSSLTIIGGVVIFALGQIISKFIIEPVHEQRKIIGEIADAIDFYANVYCNPGTWPKEKMDEVSQRLRQLATFLRSKSHLVPLYGFLATLKMVPCAHAIQEASTELISLSNSLYGEPGDRTRVVLSNADRADKIKKSLGPRFNN
jgi:hypothetical protein